MGLNVMSNEFGDRLKECLKNIGYTQKRATEELGLSKNAIANYVAGRIPDALILYKIAKLCSVSMEWLLTGHDPLIQSPSANSTDELEEHFLNKYRELSPSNRMKVLGYMDALSQNFENK